MKTTSELAFESFLKENNLTFEKIEEKTTRRPDYLVQIGDVKLIFEIKELARDKDFAVGSRTIGDHVRRKIDEARGQVRYAAAQGIPAVLLVYNNLDPHYSFGTEDHDFVTAMYGEYTLNLNRSTGAIVDSFHGRNQSMREGRNTEFSAVGRLKQGSKRMLVTLWENHYAQVKLLYEKLPTCFDVKRVNIEYLG
jgi:hypothetical protein